jgi:hypothetical protein
MLCGASWSAVVEESRQWQIAAAKRTPSGVSRVRKLREQFPDLRREEAWLALSMLNDETQDAVRRFLDRRGFEEQ